MKLKYIGETFYNGVGLTNNKIYECIEILEEEKMLRIIDDEDYLYSIGNSSPLNGSSKGGKWKIIEDKNGKLNNVFKKLSLI